MTAIRKSPIVSLAVILTLALTLLAPLAAAHAVEVPSTTTEVRIPLVLTTEGGAVAGGEIEFEYSAGLTYVGYQPATGLANPVGTQIDGKTYAGFFAADNQFEPSGGRLSFGNLVFTYTGAGAESITITEIDLHRRTATGGVDSQRTATNTVIPVTRGTAGGAGTGNETGNGAGNGSGNNTNPIYPGNPAGTGSPGTAVVPVAAQTGAGATEAEAIELSAETGDARTAPRTTLNRGGAADAGTNANGAGIADADTPLAGASAAFPGNTTSGLPLAAWLGIIAAALAVLALILLLVRRKKHEAITKSVELEPELEPEAGRTPAPYLSKHKH